MDDLALRAAILPVTPLQQNCTLIWCTATLKAAVVDPGGDVDRILALVERAGVTVEKLLLTHGHADHAGGAAELSAALAVAIEGPHEEDRFLVADIVDQAARFGLHARPFEPARWLADGDRVTVGDLVLDVYHTPGHTPGHVIFHHAPSRFAQVGDVLFQGSVGRTDFPRSDHQALVRSVVTRLWPLGDDTAFICGHGPTSTFGHERRSNPFVGDAALNG
jgi:glyoxylase-like metal-dependent hydrolase (beta-lactamase superfamily II)